MNDHHTRARWFPPMAVPEPDVSRPRLRRLLTGSRRGISGLTGQTLSPFESGGRRRDCMTYAADTRFSVCSTEKRVAHPENNFPRVFLRRVQDF